MEETYKKEIERLLKECHDIEALKKIYTILVLNAGK